MSLSKQNPVNPTGKVTQKLSSKKYCKSSKSIHSGGVNADCTHVVTGKSHKLVTSAKVTAKSANADTSTRKVTTKDKVNKKQMSKPVAKKSIVTKTNRSPIKRKNNKTTNSSGPKKARFDSHFVEEDSGEEIPGFVSEDDELVNDVRAPSLSSDDLASIVDMLSQKLSGGTTLPTPPEDAQDDSDDEVNLSAHNNLSQAATSAHPKAKSLMDKLDLGLRSDKSSQAPSPLAPSTGISPSKDDNGISNKSDGFHFSDEGLSRFIAQISSLRQDDNNHSNDRPIPNNDSPSLGAFGEIKNKNSHLAINKQRGNILDWDLTDAVNFPHRLLKSGLNRSYNDLVVRELVWPNDLVLRGSERVKLLEMTHSEFFQAVLKTILGTLPKDDTVGHAKDLIKYFTAMFRDAKDDQLIVTLRAHKTVMGQLEKGELSVDSDWHEWDEVRRQSVLSQTLHNLSSLSAKARNVSNNTAKPTNTNGGNSQNHGNNGGSPNDSKPKGGPRPCVYYNGKRCFKKDDHSDAKHPNWTWWHICDLCWTNRKDKARHPAPDCPFQNKEVSKNGEGPFKGQ